jgi:hypothetical protein
MLDREEIIVTILALAPSTLDALAVVRELNHRINNDFTSATNIVSVGVSAARGRRLTRSTAAWELMLIDTPMRDAS